MPPPLAGPRPQWAFLAVQGRRHKAARSDEGEQRGAGVGTKATRPPMPAEPRTDRPAWSGHESTATEGK